MQFSLLAMLKNVTEDEVWWVSMFASPLWGSEINGKGMKTRAGGAADGDVDRRTPQLSIGSRA